MTGTNKVGMGKREQNPSSSLCRLFLCWSTPSIPTRPFTILPYLAFTFCLHNICRPARGENSESSWAFSEHVFYLGYTHGLLDSPVYMGAFKTPILLCISFSKLFHGSQFKCCPLLQAAVSHTFAIK